MTGGSPLRLTINYGLLAHNISAPPPADTLPASQTILESLRKRRGAETAAWLNSLTAAKQTPAPAMSGTQSTEVQHEHQLMQWLDKLFDQLELYASRFNRTAQGTDFIVTCTRPHMNGQPKAQSDETVNINTPEKIYEGHLVTRFWAMFLRGAAGTINV